MVSVIFLNHKKRYEDAFSIFQTGTVAPEESTELFSPSKSTEIQAGSI